MAYLSPGVYVKEVPSAVKPIAGVSTSTAAFIGLVPDKIHLIAPDPATSPTATKFVDFAVTAAVKTPVLITNWTQFTNTFGDFIGTADMAATTDASPAIDDGQRQLAHAVYGFFNNGGSRCYVTRVASFDTDLDAVLTAFAAIDEIALVVAPGQLSDSVRDKIVAHCQNTAERFAIFDGPSSVTDLTTLTRTAADTPTGGVMPKTTNFAAWYYPWIKAFDPATKLSQVAQGVNGDGSLAVPPSGHLAGIYARVDTQRGVFKAPANEAIIGALDVTHKLSRADQDGLNPKGVNCIRVLNDNIFVWGARTIGGDDNADLKYINVRRTLLFLRESIDQGTQWVVFEPNDPGLWAKITRNITAFLTTVWRSGALFGTTAAEAFYVKCDAETNPPELRDVGQVVTEIGVSIVKPAEFVIFRLSQYSAPSK